MAIILPRLSTLLITNNQLSITTYNTAVAKPVISLNNNQRYVSKYNACVKVVTVKIEANAEKALI